MTIPELEALKEKIIQQLLSGSQVIEFEGRRIEKRSVREITDILRWLDGQITAGEDTGFRRVRKVVTDKDL